MGGWLSGRKPALHLWGTRDNATKVAEVTLWSLKDRPLFVWTSPKPRVTEEGLQVGSGLGKMPVGAEPGRWDQEMAALPQLAFPSEPSHLPRLLQVPPDAPPHPETLCSRPLSLGKS